MLNCLQFSLRNNYHFCLRNWRELALLSRQPIWRFPSVQVDNCKSIIHKSKKRRLSSEKTFDHSFLPYSFKWKYCKFDFCRVAARILWLEQGAASLACGLMETWTRVEPRPARLSTILRSPQLATSWWTVSSAGLFCLPAEHDKVNRLQL